MMQTHDMVRMANQMADYFKSYTEQEAIEGIAEHINKFWAPPLRRDFFMLVDSGGAGLHQLVMKAAAGIKRPKAA
jgi:formate dehydrogenase subunit delta